MILAAGGPSAVTVGTNTASVAGAAPKLHIIIDPMLTCGTGIDRPYQNFRSSALNKSNAIYRARPDTLSLAANQEGSERDAAKCQLPICNFQVTFKAQYQKSEFGFP